MVLNMRKLIVLAISVMMLVIVGCGSDNSDKSADSAVIDNVELKTLSYNALDELKNEHTGKVMLVNFFASWCPPCRGETPDFVKVYNENKDKNFVIVGLSVDEKVKDAVKYMKEFGVTYPVYMADGSLKQRYGITTIPTNIIYDPNGQMIDLIVGPVSEEHMLALMEKYSK